MTHDDLDAQEQHMRDTINTGDAEAIIDHAESLDVADRQRQRRLAATPLGDAALWYADHGIPIFPLQPRGKLPATKHGFQDATTDRDQIRQWWHDMPAANIGTPTGHQFDVIDIDGAEGANQWAQLTENDGLPPILGRAGTPRPGGNHLYIAATGRGNKTAFLPGMDYRGIGGYVVAPPSLGANARRYVWIRQLDLTGDNAPISGKQRDGISRGPAGDCCVVCGRVGIDLPKDHGCERE